MLVSLITVVLNGEKTIARTIESVLSQTYPEIEYTIIDGLSSDNTVQITESYREQFKRRKIRYTILPEKDRGMYDALNKGIRFSRGTIIGSINSDDWYEAGAVEKMAELYEKTHFDVAWGDLRIITPNGCFTKRAHVGVLWTTTGWCHPSMFATKEIYNQFSYRQQTIYDDFDFITRVHCADKKIVLLNEVIANFSFGGMSTKKSLQDAAKRIRIKYSIYRENGLSRLYWFHCVAMELAKYICG